MRGNLYRVDLNPCPGQNIFVTRDLTRDLFAVDNIFVDTAG